MNPKLQKWLSFTGVMLIGIGLNGLRANFTDITASTPLFDLEQLPSNEVNFTTGSAVRGGTPIVMDWEGDGDLDLYIVRFQLEDVLFPTSGGGSFSR